MKSKKQKIATSAAAEQSASANSIEATVSATVVHPQANAEATLPNAPDGSTGRSSDPLSADANQIVQSAVAPDATANIATTTAEGPVNGGVEEGGSGHA